MVEDKNSDDNVKVIVRCRPLNKTEKDSFEVFDEVFFLIFEVFHSSKLG